MGLRAVFAEALPGIFTAAGEAAVFTPEAGDPVPCFVFIDFNVMLQPSGIETQVYEQGTTIEALLSDIGREPDRGETFTVYPSPDARLINVDGVVYAVKAPITNDGLTVKMAVT